jgi:hypothetical protein
MTPVDLSVDLKMHGSLADFEKIFGTASAANSPSPVILLDRQLLWNQCE